MYGVIEGWVAFSEAAAGACKGLHQTGRKDRLWALLVFNRQPRLVISALTELICHVAPEKLKVLLVNSSFEKNQVSNYLVWSLITQYWSLSKMRYEKPEAPIKSSSNAIDLFVFIIKFFCFYVTLLDWRIQVCGAEGAWSILLHAWLLALLSWWSSNDISEHSLEESQAGWWMLGTLIVAHLRNLGCSWAWWQILCFGPSC